MRRPRAAREGARCCGCRRRRRRGGVCSSSVSPSRWPMHPPTAMSCRGRPALTLLSERDLPAEALVGVLAHAARHEDDDVGVVGAVDRRPCRCARAGRRRARSRACSSGTRRCGSGRCSMAEGSVARGVPRRAVGASEALARRQERLDASAGTRRCRAPGSGRRGPWKSVPPVTSSPCSRGELGVAFALLGVWSAWYASMPRSPASTSVGMRSSSRVTPGCASTGIAPESRMIAMTSSGDALRPCRRRTACRCRSGARRRPESLRRARRPQARARRGYGRPRRRPRARARRRG